MAWSRPPIGNLLTESFEEIWRGEKLEILRREFEDIRHGLDCLHCTVRRSETDADDDFFYRKLAMPFTAV